MISEKKNLVSGGNWGPEVIFYAKYGCIFLFAIGIILQIKYKEISCLLSFTNSIIGSYLLLKTCSYYVRGFPSEIEIYLYFKYNEIDAIDQLITDEVIKYYIVWIIMLCFGIFMGSNNKFKDQDGLQIDDIVEPLFEDQVRNSINLINLEENINMLEFKPDIEIIDSKYLFKYPGDVELAKRHASTKKIGYETIEKCECCNRVIPSPCLLNSSTVKRYFGADLLNLIFSRSMYIYYYSIFILVEILEIILQHGFMKFTREANFYRSDYRSDNNILFFPQNDITPFDIAVPVFSLVLICGFYGSFVYKKFVENHNVFEENLYSDDSIFSIFVKNIKGIPHEKFLEFFKEKYEVDIKDIHYINFDKDFIENYDYCGELKLELETNIEKKKVLEEYVADNINKIKSLDKHIKELKGKLNKHLPAIEHQLNQSFNPETAVITFNKCEDKYKFIHKQFSIYRFFCADKLHKYKINNNIIYFEEVPQISFINWKNVNFCMQKHLRGWNKLKIFGKVLFITSISFGIYLLNIILLSDTFVKFFKETVKVPFSFSIFMMVFNILVEFLFGKFVDTFELTNIYNTNILHKYLIMNKTYIITFTVYLNKFLTNVNSSSKDYQFLLEYLITTSVVNIVLTVFNLNYIFNYLVKYVLLVKLFKKKLFQIEMNEIFLSNSINIHDSFNKLRICLFSTLFIIPFLPIASIYMSILFFIHLYVINYVLVNTCFKEINYLGNFFKFFFQIDFLRVLIIPVYPLLFFYMKENFFIKYILTNFIIDFAVSFSFNSFDTTFPYSEVENMFNRKISEVGYLNKEYLKRSIQEIKNKLE